MIFLRSNKKKFVAVALLSLAVIGIVLGLSMYWVNLYSNIPTQSIGPRGGNNKNKYDPEFVAGKKQDVVITYGPTVSEGEFDQSFIEELRKEIEKYQTGFIEGRRYVISTYHSDGTWISLSMITSIVVPGGGSFALEEGKDRLVKGAIGYEKGNGIWVVAIDGTKEAADLECASPDSFISPLSKALGTQDYGSCGLDILTAPVRELSYEISGSIMPGEEEQEALNTAMHRRWGDELYDYYTITVRGIGWGESRDWAAGTVKLWLKESGFDEVNFILSKSDTVWLAAFEGDKKSVIEEVFSWIDEEELQPGYKDYFLGQDR